MSEADGGDAAASAVDLPTALSRGSLFGLGAWLVALLVVGGVATAGDLPFTDAVPLWKGWSWYFLDAQFVPVSRTGGARSARLDLIALVDSPLTPLAYVAPPLALVAAGALAVRDGLFGGRSSAVGAALLPGYALPMLAVAALGSHTVTVDLVVTTVSQTVAAEVGPALALVAVCYPLAFGGIGGLLAARLGANERPTD